MYVCMYVCSMSIEYRLVILLCYNRCMHYHQFLFRVAKKIAPSGAGEDLDLNNDYYVLYGRRRRASSRAGSLMQHETNPLISSRVVNVVTAGGSVGAQLFPTQPLLRFHGILMIIAWPLLALCGIFFASWMRPALPNGEWFQVRTRY